MRAHSRATSASIPGRSPMSAMAVGRSSASSTNWKPITGFTQVPRAGNGPQAGSGTWVVTGSG
ncbi:hypothetical protein LEMLEM_LOCUS22988 [Lemmus lemmus]